MKPIILITFYLMPLHLRILRFFQVERGGITILPPVSSVSWLLTAGMSWLVTSSLCGLFRFNPIQYGLFLKHYGMGGIMVPLVTLVFLKVEGQNLVAWGILMCFLKKWH